MKVGDKVKIIAGNNKGAEAKIVKMDRKGGRACLEGIGIIERHLKKTQYNPADGKKTIHVGIELSNLKLVEAGEKAAKVNNVRYNLAGQKVDASYKGIVIMNGKKFMQK